MEVVLEACATSLDTFRQLDSFPSRLELEESETQESGQTVETRHTRLSRQSEAGAEDSLQLESAADLEAEDRTRQELEVSADQELWVKEITVDLVGPILLVE